MALANLRRINRWADRSTMLRGLIAFCLLRRALVLIAFAAFLGLGLVAFTALNIEAYPDPAPPIVQIIAQRPGQSPEDRVLCVHRPSTGRGFHRHRLPSAAAVGLRDCRRHVAVADLQPARDPNI